MNSSNLTSILLAFGGGFLTALTPCVYPLIPITWGVMRAGKSVSLKKGFLLSLSFALGLTVVYSILGFAAASSGKLFGAWLSAGWIPWVLSLLFLAMALSLFGLYEIRLPYTLQQWLSKRGGPGLAGSFLMGGASGLIAAPCTGPVLIGILGYVATEASPLRGLGLLVAFSLGLSSPFIFLGTFSSAVDRLPKGGAWTEWIKHLCGFGFLAIFFVYLHPLISPLLFTGLLSFSLLILAIFLGRLLPGLAPRWQHVGRIAFVLAASGAILSAYPPRESVSAEKKNSSMVWLKTEKDALVAAAKSKMPVMIDFWADWCVACHELENETYTDPRVAKILQNDFVLLKIDATDVTPDVAELTQKYSVLGLPTVLFLNSKGALCKDLTLTGFVEADEFLPLLEKAKRCA